MKRITIFISILLISLTGLFANGSTEQKTDNGPITIKYAFWGNPEAIGVEQDIIDAFEVKHPNIKIETIVSPHNDYHAKILTMIAGGMAPDVMRINSYNFQDFTSLGTIENLDPYITKDNFDLSIYPVASIDEATVDGHVSALPWGTAPMYIALNIDAFEKAGIPMPSYDWTMDEFFNIIKEFNGQETGTYGFAADNGQLTSYFPFIWAEGGNLFSDDLNTYTLNNPEAYKTIQQLANLYQQGYMPKDSITSDTEVFTRWFVNGSLAMMGAASMQVLTFQKIGGVRFEVYPLPGGSVVKNTTVYKSNEICMAKDSKHKDAAWEFMKFLRGNEGEKFYVNSKRVPPMLTNDNTLWPSYVQADVYPLKIEEVTNLIAKKYGHKLPLRKGYAEANSLVMPVIQKIMMGDVSAKEGFASLSTKMTELIQRNN